MFKAALKIKRKVAYLLLFSFLNVMTFLPGSHLEFLEAGNVAAASTINNDEEFNRSTVLELILENFAGLEDGLPESEKPDFSYDYFSIKFRCISGLLLHFIAPTIQQEENKTPLIAAIQDFPPTQAKDLPLLQHHNFIFRLTPF
ncbi:MAG: hypothetical protein QM802_12555 [Agriterribacter sp.]